MPSPRFRIRTLMILVAVVAIVMALNPKYVQLAQKSQNYRAIARRCRSAQSDCQASAIQAETIERNVGGKEFAEIASKSRKSAAMCAELAARYEQAARWPWLSVDPDKIRAKYER